MSTFVSTVDIGQRDVFRLHGVARGAVEHAVCGAQPNMDRVVTAQRDEVDERVGVEVAEPRLPEHPSGRCCRRAERPVTEPRMHQRAPVEALRDGALDQVEYSVAGHVTDRQAGCVDCGAHPS